MAADTVRNALTEEWSNGQAAAALTATGTNEGPSRSPPIADANDTTG